MITVLGKGAKERVLPLRGRVVILAGRSSCSLGSYLEGPLDSGGRRSLDDYLLHPQWVKGGVVYNARPKAAHAEADAPPVVVPAPPCGPDWSPRTSSAA